MKIKSISDIHLEHHPDNGSRWLRLLLQETADVLVIAGDLIPLNLDHQKVRDRVLKALCNHFPHVVYVFGNHEFYDGSPAVVQRFRDSKAVAKLPNLHLLQEETVTLDGIKFAGTTLWFPDDPLNPLFEKQWSDFKSIADLRRWVYEANREAVKFLTGTDADVWITHFPPTIASADPRYRGNEYGRFTLTDLSDLIMAKAPTLCLHGHIHWQFDYQLDRTRIVCEPHGYPHDSHLIEPQTPSIQL